MYFDRKAGACLLILSVVCGTVVLERPAGGSQESLLLDISELSTAASVIATSTEAPTTVQPTLVTQQIVNQNSTDNTHTAADTQVHRGRERGSNLAFSDAASEKPSTTRSPLTTGSAEEGVGDVVSSSAATEASISDLTTTAPPITAGTNATALAAAEAASHTAHVEPTANMPANSDHLTELDQDEASETAVEGVNGSDRGHMQTTETPANAVMAEETTTNPLQELKVSLFSTHPTVKSDKWPMVEVTSTPAAEVLDPSTGEMKVDLKSIFSNEYGESVPQFRPATPPVESSAAVSTPAAAPAAQVTGGPTLSRHRTPPGVGHSDHKPSKGRAGVQDLDMLNNPSKPRKGAPPPADGGGATTAASVVPTLQSAGTQPAGATIKDGALVGTQPAGDATMLAGTPAGGGPVGASPSTATLVGAVILVILAGVMGFFAFRRCKESWYRRHYRKMDFLVDGMYNL